MGKQQTAGQIKESGIAAGKRLSRCGRSSKADRICLSPLPSPFLDFTQSRSLRVTMRNPETGTVTPLKGWVGNM